jgi:hypothetical protein
MSSVLRVVCSGAVSRLSATALADMLDRVLTAMECAAEQYLPEVVSCVREVALAVFLPVDVDAATAAAGPTAAAAASDVSLEEVCGRVLHSMQQVAMSSPLVRAVSSLILHPRIALQ